MQTGAVILQTWAIEYSALASFSVQNTMALTCAKNHAHWFRHCEDVESNIMVSFFGPPCFAHSALLSRPIPHTVT